MDSTETEPLRLTDFVDVATLQEIQDSFASVAGVKATITDAAGRVLTQPNPSREFLRRQLVLGQAGDPAPQRDGAEFVAPITVGNQQLGTIRMATNGIRGENKKGAAVQFLFLMANAIARLCFQEYQLRQRIHELTAVYNMAMMLSDARDLQRVLQRTVKVVCDVMETKAASIRLFDVDKDELVIKAVFNLSDAYQNKGPVRMSSGQIDQLALSPIGFEYVRNMATDPRVQYPQEAVREGIVSMLSVGMRYKGKSIGVLRVYTAEEQAFSPLKIDLLKATAAQAAAAIENARLHDESLQAAALEKQVHMAADVQQRMIPQKPPEIPGLDLASVYVPCYELGGDFFDFIPLQDDNVGLVVADVSGKGVPASLIMASVRAFLRAQVDNVYFLYEVIRRINLMLCRDTKTGEFVTLFYGVLDGRSRRFTYCNAGHSPALVLRNGKVIELTTDNMVLGINEDEQYTQSFIDLQKDDLVLLYTDGLTDAMNFSQETWGRKRLVKIFEQGGDSAEIVAQNILWEMRKFVGMAQRTDDITMIVCRVL